ncbi:MAG: ATP-binding protein, partial [Solirubrobacteraceae bacterium]|nr:ATP-binding protein [Solirubrobacteraceae bacterium]
AVGGELAAAPQPSLADVEALAARARDSGLRVELRVEGAPVALPAGVDLAAYRIVQEALTNTAKHAGPTRARVVVRYEERAVALEVGDDGRGPAAPPAPAPAPNGVAGHGLAGMRERVALYGGTLDVGRRPGGGFRVQARLPIGRRERGTVGSHAQPSPRSGRMPSTASRRATVGNDDAERRPPR